MKKIFSSIHVLFLVLLMPFVGFSQLPFFDGFESGTMDNWETTGEEPAIISLEAYSYSGTKFIRVQNSYSIGKQISLQDEETGMVEFAAKMSFTNAQSLIFQVYDNHLRIMAKVHFFDDGKIYAKNFAGDQELIDYVADIWYLIRLEFDQIAKTYDVYIDNTLLLEDLSYVTADCEYINRFKFYSTELISSQCYLDAITIEGDDLEKDALMALYNATNGENWTNDTNWMSEDPISDWHGVSTDIDGKVIQVILNNNQLNGTIPAEIGDLANLEFLALSENQLSGIIPAEIGNCTNLSDLSLSDNQLSGSIPSEIWGLDSLESLNLWTNQLTGSIPPEVGNLIKLNTIDLSSNSLSGSIPKEIRDLVTLEYLGLSNNQLSGPVPVEIGNLIMLQSLFLHFNELSDSIPDEIGNLTNLIDLNLHENQFEGSVPSSFGNLTSLNELRVDNNQLNIFPSELSSLNLAYSVAYFNDFTFEDLNNMPVGTSYNPQNTIHLNDTIYLDSTVGGIIQLDFDDEITSSTYNWYKQESFIRSTTENSLSILEEYGGTYYYSLEITNTEFPGFTLEMDSIIVIVEGESINDIGRDILVSLYNATDGENWTIKTNWLSDEPNGEWYGVTTDVDDYIIEIDLEGNNLIGILPTELGDLIKINTLNLNNNELSGSVPPEMGGLGALLHLDLAHNQLTGSIHSALSNLQQLEIFLLNNNQFSGSIPSFLTAFSDLQELNLSANQLTGMIPSGLGNLTSLDLLYLEENLLDSIPSSFLNLNISSSSVKNNNFTFEDIENIPVGVEYNPQNTVHANDTTYLEAGITGVIQLDFDGDVINSSYDWYREGVYAATTSGNGIMATEGPGTAYFSLEITNTNYPGFTLYVDSVVVITEEADTEKASLIAIYNATDGNNWTDNTNWKTAANLEDWYGVTTNVDGHITNLTLGSNNLNGTIPSEIGNLTYLQELRFESNQLSGAIPSEIGSLVQLEYLELYQNSLSGEIPAEIGSLVSLIRTRMNQNNLTGTIPIEFGNLVVTRDIELGENSLSGEIPIELFNIDSLRTLYLDGNNLTGNLASEIANMSRIENLNLSDNQLSGVIPSEIGALNNLIDFRISNNQFTGGPPSEMINLSQLNIFYFSNNLFSTFSSDLIGLSLSSSSGSNNNFTIEDIENFPIGMSYSPQNIKHAFDTTYLEAGITGLIQLDFDGNVNNSSYEWYREGSYMSTTDGNSILATESNVGTVYFTLQITNSNYSGLFLSVDSVIVIVSEPAAEKAALIELYNSTDGDNWTDNTNWLSDAPLDQWFGIYADIDDHILEIDLHDNQLNGSLPAEIGNLNNLQMLQLYDNANLDGSLPPEIGNLINLEHLAIFNTTIQGNLPSELGNLSALKKLMLGGNNLTGSIPAELGNLPVLERIWIEDNELTGSIPTELGNADSLNYLYISGNNLTGTIPDELGLLPKMQNLILSGNNLYGEIPVSIGNLTLLHDFRIDDNQISGAIPASFGNLSNLFNFYFNSNLLDEVPSSLANLTLNDGNGSDNKFTFEDIQNLPADVSYGNQKIIDIIDTIHSISGEDYNYLLTFDQAVLNSSYEWYRDGVYFETRITADLIINELGDEQPHYFYAIISNSNYANFSLITDSLVVETNNCTVELSHEVNNVSCYGNNDGSILIIPSAGAEPYEYSIDSGYTYSENNLFENMTAGNYDLKIMDANSCESDIYTVLITEPIFLELSMSTQNLTCFESNDGIIEFNGSGGLSPYEYSIDSGISWQNESLFENLLVGTYDAILRDSNACTVYQEVVLAQPENGIEFSEIITDVLCTGEANGNLEILAIGGTPEYQYSKDNGSTFQSNSIFNNLISGNYSIVVKDANECISSHEVEILEPEELGFTENKVDVNCFGESTGGVQIIGAGGSGGYVYRLGNQNWQEYNVFLDLAAGEYEFSIRDGNLCISSHYITINEPDEALGLTVIVSNVQCFNGDDGQIEILGSGGALPYEFSIDNGDDWQSESMFSNLLAGEYDLLIQDDNECMASDLAIITQPESLPEVSFTDLESNYCEDIMEVILIGNQAPSGVFTGIGIVDNADGTASFSPSVAGIGGPYEITYTFSDENGCSNLEIQTTSISEVVEIEFSGLSDSYCVNADAVVLVGSEAPIGNFTGLGIIDNGDGTADFNPNVAGVGGPYNIVYQYESENLCISQVVHETVIINLPNISFTGLDPASCIDAPAQLLVGSHAPEGSFVGPGIIDNNDGTAVFSPSIVGVGGPYTMVYNYTNAEGCSNSISQQTSVYDLPTVSFDGLELNYCEGATEIIITGSEAPNGSFSGTAVFDQGDGTAYFHPVIAGVGGPFSVIYSFENSNGCIGTESQETMVVEMPIVSFTDLEDGYCQTNSAIVLTGNYAPEGYFAGEGITDNGDGTALFEPAEIVIGGPYEIKYEYETPEGCIDEEIQEVEIYQVDELSFEGLLESYCSEESAILITGSMAPEGVYTGVGVTDNEDGTALFSPQEAGPGGPYDIQYFYTNGNNCYSETTESTTVHLTPEISFTGLGSAYCIDSEPIVLTGDQTTGLYTGPGIVDNEDGTAIFTPSNAGAGTNHEIVFSVTSNEGCYAEDIQQVDVEALQELSFEGLESDYCFSNPSSIITGNMIPFGTFSGQGITDNGDGTAIFDPQISGIGGPYIITYEYETGVCVNTFEQEVMVHNSTAVSFTGLDEAYCNVNTEFVLTGSEAPFGYFSGEGILDNEDGTASFNPSLLGVGGPFILTYHFENGNGCISYFDGSVLIVDGPTSSFDYSLGGCVEDAIFIDQSTSPNGDIIDWNWNFDDPDSEGSNISDTQNPLHQFISNQSAFTIKLVVGDELGCFDSIEQVIEPFSTSTINGHVYSSDGSDIIDGYVLAYLHSDSIISTQVDSVQIAEDGSFSCLEMATCVDYIFRAYANEIVYPDVMPRWHIDAYFWLDATPVSINWDDEIVDNIDINVYKVPLPPAGTSGLGGGVYYTGGKGEPVKNVDVVLEFEVADDKGDEVVGYKPTDELGRWEFDKLGEGTFKIRVDIPGLNMDSVYTVTISAPNTNITNLDYYIDPEHGIYTAPTGLDEFDDLGFGSIGVFPNPNTGQFYLEIIKADHISRLNINTVQLWDMEGRLIKDLGIEFKGDHYLSHLNLSDIEPGMYFIKMKNKEEVGVVKFVIQR